MTIVFKGTFVYAFNSSYKNGKYFNIQITKRFCTYNNSKITTVGYYVYEFRAIKNVMQLYFKKFQKRKFSFNHLKYNQVWYNIICQKVIWYNVIYILFQNKIHDWFWNICLDSRPLYIYVYILMTTWYSHKVLTCLFIVVTCHIYGDKLCEAYSQFVLNKFL